MFFYIEAETSENTVAASYKPEGRRSDSYQSEANS